ncbi:DUF4040 domain-containing protein [Streptomyces sp. NPDC097704]|uniref:Na(+)/H(+) antiporter subunit B n=1 Tax=unclassified Streptomyces TaxID=2593676 RepID=UPI003324C079
MNEWLVGVALAFVVLTATVAVLTRDPTRQAVVLSVLGLGLAMLFAVLQAPDVAMSQLAVGTALTPLMILLTVRKITREPARDPARENRDHGERDGTGEEERG